MAAPRALVGQFLQQHLPMVALASLCALLLGLVSTIVVSLLGPCFQLLLNPSETTSIATTELFGPHWRFIAPQLTVPSLSRETLLFHLPLLLLSLASLKALFSISQNVIWERLGEQLGRGLRLRLTRSFIMLDPNSRANKHEGELASLLATDIKLLRDYLVHFYGGLPRELTQIFFMGASLLLLSPKLSALFVFGLAPAGVIIGRLGKKLRRRATSALDHYAELSEWLQGRLLGIETIKHYHSETLETRKFSQLTNTLYGKFLKAARLKARTSPYLEAIALCSLVLVLIVALAEINSGRLSSSNTISYFAALAMLCQSVATVGRYVNANREGAAAAERLSQALEFFAGEQLEALSLQAEEFADPEILMVCQQVSAGYKDKPEVISGFFKEFKRGKFYALIGPSGVGKSTLGRLVLGLQKPSSGSIAYQRTMLARYPLALGYVPQKIQLLHGSIAENLAYPFAPPADLARLWRSLAGVGLEEFVRGLPQGIHTRVGSLGQGLSGGQEQRLYLARLGCHPFALAVIDEGTSALDGLSEERVCNFLDELRSEGMTLIFITHRSSLVQLADEVITLGYSASAT